MHELSPAEIARLLRATGQALQAEVGALPVDVAQFHSAPDEWCVNEVIGHLIEAEGRGFAGRIRAIVDGQTQLLTWNQEDVARARADCTRTPREVLAELMDVREASARLVEDLTSADLEKFGDHPKIGVLHVRELLQEWVHHDRVHHEQVLSTVRKAIWPYLGATQGFYDV